MFKVMFGPGKQNLVAQNCNLLYRRLAVCKGCELAAMAGLSDALQIKNLRYSSLKNCATLKSATGERWKPLKRLRHHEAPFTGLKPRC
jgi:hypothetical protein